MAVTLTNLRLLVCGSRDYADRDRVFRVLDFLHKHKGITEVLHGAARGADSLAAEWAKDRMIPEWAFPADWNRDGLAAGYRRNRRMLDEGKPDHVLAFPGGKGTDMMIDIARKAGVPVTTVSASHVQSVA